MNRWPSKACLDNLRNQLTKQATKRYNDCYSKWQSITYDLADRVTTAYYKDLFQAVLDRCLEKVKLADLNGALLEEFLQKGRITTTWNSKYVSAVGARFAAYADITWITSNDEAGSRIVMTRVDPAAARIAPAATTALALGDISPDRQYFFTGEGSGWQLRPMGYQFQGGRIVHVDDPVGHMNRLADTTPLTEQQRKALERSSGS